MPPHQLNVIETSHVSPPRGSAPSVTLPLTFFDVPWLTLPLVQSVFFYSYNDSTAQFLSDTLPILKHSLSLTLQHFYPFAGALICPPRPEPPYLRFIDGQDSLLFTVAESTEHNFEHLKADYPKDVRLLHDLLPKLPPAIEIAPERVLKRPVMAIQVTVFPNTGICIGKTQSHVSSDGVSAMHFIKYWTSMCKSMTVDRDSLHRLSLPPPNLTSRAAIKDPADIIKGHLERFWSIKSENGDRHDTIDRPRNMVRATFSMSRAQIENLKQWVHERSANQSPVSSFVVTVAFTWACLIKSLMDDADKEQGNDETFRLLNNVDCRNRLKCDEHIPSTYFGNCMAPGIVSVKKRDLLGENGVMEAAKAIAGQIKEMLSSDILRTAPTWSGEVRKWVMTRFKMSVAGAPQLRMYDMDFGIGKPCKVEIVHVESGDSFALLNSREGRDGIEIEIALANDRMEAFTKQFDEGIKIFTQRNFGLLNI
ncbi:PREDICTED: coumaroyl-CoA:anthocyanidin 3-O-glucoside-6''-O-coumaroyltransferase 2 [Tarenaya hassleriana]|uniref:coumaroyl-CoA:anthocyanidin 3-O-glucoside-6''-O-coumaroyltransferase 2 n=1 Tax=Tarenaya hassleriana TaxID=28532 RepID=UPI00053C8FE0|nr:PREDICTED: coumaroyl-CoA:anthocyanidin 3-O-glucoside-6''-O-coumaroyltransferase 2 [Tarenaya hassleriana]